MCPSKFMMWNSWRILSIQTSCILSNTTNLSTYMLFTLWLGEVLMLNTEAEIYAR